jgi:phage host-nuclease inhibitor protein Gam
MVDAAESQATPIASDAACAEAIAEVGRLDRILAGIETRKSAAIAATTRRFEDEATPFLAAKAALTAGVKAWCDAERRRLTGGKGKTVEFPTGKAGWRKERDTVEIPDEVEAKIVEPAKKAILGALKRLVGFYAPFVTISVRLSKTAIKAIAATDAEAKAKLRDRGIVFVPGGEAFFIEPAGAELAERPQPDEGQ